MKSNLLIAALVACALAGSAVSQTKTRSKTTRKPAPAKPAPPPDFAAERAKVGDQIANVTRFIYVYGKIVNGLEVAADHAKKNEATAAVATKNQQTKEAVVANFNNLKTGVDNLAQSFRSDARLQVQYLKVTGASDAIASAQQAANSARFDDAGKLLLTAVERLTEALLSVK